jgi:hypothetical protein
MKKCSGEDFDDVSEGNDEREEKKVWSNSPNKSSFGGRMGDKRTKKRLDFIRKNEEKERNLYNIGEVSEKNEISQSIIR